MFEKKKKNKAYKPIKAHMATKAHKLNYFPTRIT
jgi:hypothetical protein